MGCFSWLDCKTGQQIRIGTGPVYALIPKEFEGKYGSKVVEPCYNGYGRFGGYDIYDLIAEFNRESIGVKCLKKVPEFDSFLGLYSYEVEELKKTKSEEEINEIDRARRQKAFDAAVKRYEASAKRLNDFVSGKPSDYMKETYGDRYLREIGIEMFFCKLPGFTLKYPVKVTYDVSALYEECGISEDDPDQGL